MTDTPDPAYRSYTTPDSDDIEYRQPEGEDDIFEVRLPIATTGEVRNQGDEPLTRDELAGMSQQIEERTVGVFLDHGGSELGGRERYSAIEKLGEWTDPEVQSREADETDELVATARLMNPESLPNGVASIREAVGAIKEQVKRGFSVSASIGWREDSSYPGGNDLMEASIVGIGADPRTTSEASTAVVARAAVDAGADPDELVRQVREAVQDESDPDEARPFGPPGGDPNQWEDFEECVDEVSDWDNIDDPEAFCAWAEEQTKDQSARQEYEVGDTTLDITPPEYMIDAADAAQAAQADGRIPDECGTGVGDDRADQISNDEVGPDVVAEVAAYLTSHAEDVTAEGHPRDWTEEAWSDCGNAQYAKWGGTGDGRAMEWAQERANAVARARDEELPYPELTDDMSDTQDSPDEGDTTEDEQQSEQPDEAQAPEDIGEDDVAEFVAEVYDGIDAADFIEAMNEAGAEFGGLDEDTVSWFFGDVLDLTAGEVMDMLDESDEAEMDEDEDEEDEEMAADDPDAEQDADDSDLEERIASLEDELQAFRNGDLEPDTPDTDEEQDTDTDEQRDADKPSKAEKYGLYQ